MCCADAALVADVAYAGSCTAGKKEDMDMYAAVLQSAHDEGLRVHPDVKLFIQCGSQEVRQYCEDNGYLALFEEMAGSDFHSLLGLPMISLCRLLRESGLNPLLPDAPARP